MLLGFKMGYQQTLAGDLLGATHRSECFAAFTHLILPTPLPSGYPFYRFEH